VLVSFHCQVSCPKHCSIDVNMLIFCCYFVPSSGYRLLKGQGQITELGISQKIGKLNLQAVSYKAAVRTIVT